MMSILQSKRLNFLKGNYNLLLYSLLILFIFRPYDKSSFYLGIWKLFLTGTILIATFKCKHSSKLRNVEICLAIPAVLFCWWDLYWNQHWSLIGTTFLSVFFTFLCAFSIIIDVFSHKKVTFETLRGAICAYFLLAIGFAYLFWFIEWLIPGSFYISQANIPIYSYAGYISEMFYFSFTTLLTIGFGDIVPTKDIAQTATILEGFMGQFYMTIIVARLVAMYSLSAHEKTPK